MKRKGEIVSFWNLHDDGYIQHRNWYDMIGKIIGYEPVEIKSMWGENQAVNMPIFELADGQQVRYNKQSHVPILTESEMAGKLRLSRNGRDYIFIGFTIHYDSETGKPKDYLYKFKDIQTGEEVLLKPQIHNTLKYESFKVFFDIEPNF